MNWFQLSVLPVHLTRINIVDIWTAISNLPYLCLSAQPQLPLKLHMLHPPALDGCFGDLSWSPARYSDEAPALHRADKLCNARAARVCPRRQLWTTNKDFVCTGFVCLAWFLPTPWLGSHGSSSPARNLGTINLKQFKLILRERIIGGWREFDNLAPHEAHHSSVLSVPLHRPREKVLSAVCLSGLTSFLHVTIIWCTIGSYFFMLLNCSLFARICCRTEKSSTLKQKQLNSS